MAKRRSQPKPENKRERVLSQKEAEEQKKVLQVLGAIAALIAIILAVGIFWSYNVEPNQAVAIVNGVEISRADYQNRVLYERYLLDEQLGFINAQYQQQLPFVQDSPEQLQNLQDQYQQYVGRIQVQRTALDRDALELMIEEILIETEADKRGITVSDAEVTEAYEEIAAIRSGGVTQAVVAKTVTARANTTATAAMFTPTPTLTPSPTPTQTEVLTNTDVSTNPLDTDFPTPPPQPTPTFNIIEGEALSEAKATWEDTISEYTNMSPADLRRLIYLNLLREQVQQVIGEELGETTGLQAHARHILVETEEEALAVVERLEAGESFEDLALELSNDPGSAQNGGDLGWFYPGDMVPEFDEAAFSLEVNAFSNPIQTNFGWHILQVIERGERELDARALAQAQAKAYSDWLLELKGTAVEDLWSEEDAPKEVSPLF